MCGRLYHVWIELLLRFSPWPCTAKDNARSGVNFRPHFGATKLSDFWLSCCKKIHVDLFVHIVEECCVCLQTFRRKMKAHLFRRSYADIILWLSLSFAIVDLVGFFAFATINSLLALPTQYAEQGLWNGMVSVCLSQHGPTSANPLLQVCCCGPGGQDISAALSVCSTEHTCGPALQTDHIRPSSIFCCGSHSMEQSSCRIPRPNSQRCLLPTAFKDSSVRTTASAP